MKIKNLFKKRNGQSLVEVSVALTIVAIASTSMLSVVVASKNLLYDSEDRTKANSLAQEGIEIVRAQRNEGCQFGGYLLSTNLPTVANDYYIITTDKNHGDVVGMGPGSLTKSTGVVKGNDIKGFPGYERRLYIYDLDKLYNSNTQRYDWINTNFPVALDHDTKDKYIYLKVVIEWTNRYKSNQKSSFEVSTIMIKKWKDI